MNNTNDPRFCKPLAEQIKAITEAQYQGLNRKERRRLEAQQAQAKREANS